MIHCPNCGEENPDRFRLCGFCGTPLAPSLPPQETRKTVTVVFSDLKGSTALGEKLDSEALREVMSRYFEEMSGALELHGGTIEKYIGDAIMAVFGLPRIHEDDALRAVRAAAEMKRRLATLNDELEQRWGVSLANRTGVNTGEVVAGDASTGQRLVTGDTVNVAARLEQAAPALEILVGEPTYQLVRDAVEVEEVEPLELKGKSDRVGAYRLLSVQEVAETERRHRSAFVGRRDELRRLQEAFAESGRSGAPRAVTLLAEAGVGKSRLVEEFRASLARDALVLRGRCLPYGRGITFWPLGEIVRGAAAIGDDDSPEEASTKLRGLMGSGDDAVVDRLASAVGLIERQFPAEETFWAAARFFERCAAARPVVAVWEDVHWAEATLLDLIERVATTTAAPVLLLCTGRPAFLELRPDGLPGDTLELRPLAAEESERLIDAVLGDVGLGDEVRRRVIATSEGNPLYVEQMLSMLIDEGRLRRDGDRWVPAEGLDEVPIPPTVQALVAARLDLLTDEEKATIEPASVIGLQFGRDALEELVPDAVRDRLPHTLEALARKRLVAADDDGYRFAHIVIRDAAYGELLKRTRATLHERFADWGERVNRDRDRASEYEEIVAYHLEQAYRYRVELGPVDDHGLRLAARAGTKLAAAGRRAFAREDMPAAANLLRRAAELLPEEEPERLALLPDLGEALTQVGEFAWAELFLDEAVTRAESIGDTATAAEARLSQLSMQRYRGGDEADWSSAVLGEVERSVPLFERAFDDRRLARTWRLAMFAYGVSYRFADAVVAGQRAATHARRVHDGRLEAVAASTSAMAALYGPTPVDEAIALCEQALEQTSTNRKVHGFVTLLKAPLHAMLGDFDTGRALYRDASAALHESGARIYAARASLESSIVELLAGDPEAAARELRRDYDALDEMDERYLRPTVAAQLAQVLCVLGRIDEAQRFVAVAQELAAADDLESQALWRSAAAMVLVKQGPPEAAVEVAGAAVELLGRTDALVRIGEALEVQGDALLASGLDADARVVFERAASLYARKGNVVGERALLTRLAELDGKRAASSA
ncbi:MAG TPA: adenylate/guanylate cyclase domain-containing protein [Gaiellaceae bacterium]|nr:adenylate/guanylate cyclase domain-containing protein [Gaiellaceae bacterium]